MRFAAAAPAAAAQVTFVLVNDIYLMGDVRCRTASAAAASPGSPPW